jgi:hypothetical protein
MKNLNTLAIVFVTASFILVGCNSSQQLTPSQQGEVEIVEYCSGKEYVTNDEYFRAKATGTSPNRETAKKKSRSEAEGKLARSIEVLVEIVTENHVNDTQFGDKIEATGIFNEINRSIVNQTLSGAVTICEKLTQKPDGLFVSYSAIELSGEKIANAYNERLSKDERIMAEFNYENFKKTFEEEMSKQK